MNQKQVDDAIDTVFSDAVNRLIAHDSKLDPQGYSQMLIAFNALVLTIMSRDAG